MRTVKMIAGAVAILCLAAAPSWAGGFTLQPQMSGARVDVDGDGDEETLFLRPTGDGKPDVVLTFAVLSAGGDVRFYIGNVSGTLVLSHGAEDLLARQIQLEDLYVREITDRLSLLREQSPASPDIQHLESISSSTVEVILPERPSVPSVAWFEEDTVPLVVLSTKLREAGIVTGGEQGRDGFTVVAGEDCTWFSVSQVDSEGAPIGDDIAVRLSPTALTYQDLDDYLERHEALPTPYWAAATRCLTGGFFARIKDDSGRALLPLRSAAVAGWDVHWLPEQRLAKAYSQDHRWFVLAPGSPTATTCGQHISLASSPSLLAGRMYVSREDFGLLTGHPVFVSPKLCLAYLPGSP